VHHSYSPSAGRYSTPRTKPFTGSMSSAAPPTYLIPYRRRFATRWAFRSVHAER